MNKKTKDALAKVMAESLPDNLTEEQAQFWIDNPECLSEILNDLTRVVVSQLRSAG
jgi:hypothetical protein